MRKNSEDPITLHEGILPVNKPAGKTSFSLIRVLRKKTHIKKIGHAGTLDPFATGVMILLIGRNYTIQSNQFIDQDKEYLATLHLGIETTTYDPEGNITSTNDYVPSLQEIQRTLIHFQGTIQQIPPMYSAKKIQGKKLYQLARKGLEIAREPVTLDIETILLSYSYPFLELKITCSKGTYIRSIAYDIGKMLSCGAYLKNLTRTRCGPYTLEDCISGEKLYQS